MHVRSARYFPAAQGIMFSSSTTFKYVANIKMGDHVRLGPGVVVGAKAEVTLGNYSRISQGAVVETAGLDLSKPLPYPHIANPIHIGEGAWICANAVVLGGVSVGERAVVAAGAVVTKDVAPWTIVAGNPARKIGQVSWSEESGNGGRKSGPGTQSC